MQFFFSGVIRYAKKFSQWMIIVCHHVSRCYGHAHLSTNNYTFWHFQSLSIVLNNQFYWLIFYYRLSKLGWRVSDHFAYIGNEWCPKYSNMIKSILALIHGRNGSWHNCLFFFKRGSKLWLNSYCCGRFGRGVQPPSRMGHPHPNPQPPHKLTQKVFQMLVLPLFDSIITDGRTDGQSL